MGWLVFPLQHAPLWLEDLTFNLSFNWSCGNQFLLFTRYSMLVIHWRPPQWLTSSGSRPWSLPPLVDCGHGMRRKCGGCQFSHLFGYLLFCSIWLFSRLIQVYFIPSCSCSVLRFPLGFYSASVLSLPSQEGEISFFGASDFELFVKTLQWLVGKFVSFFSLAIQGTLLYTTEMNLVISKGMRTHRLIKINRNLCDEIAHWIFLETWDDPPGLRGEMNVTYRSLSPRTQLDPAGGLGVFAWNCFQIGLL